jgi:3-hydroxyacyl-[acyl-carrier-protein] dehydratase
MTPALRPWLPRVLAETRAGDTVTLRVQVPADLAHFDGHFPGTPIVPGVLQIGWALAFASSRLGTSPDCAHVEGLKFQHLLRPGDIATLTLRHEATTRTLHFGCREGERAYASGRLRVEATHG